MRVRDIMSRPVVSVRTDTTIRAATAVLADSGFCALPVVDDVGRVVGVFGQADAIRVDGGRAAPEAPVTEAMTTPAEVVGPADDTALVAARMLRTHLRSMPVVEEGLLIGMVARQDLLRTLVHDDDVLAGRVRSLLDDYAGSRRRWTVTVENGAVRVGGAFADGAERGLITALARSVDGITAVELTTQEPLDLAWRD